MVRAWIAIFTGFVVSGCYTTATFRPYEARNAVMEGQGGAKEMVDGVDIWTDGDPPRRYQVLSTIQLEGYERYGSPMPVLASKVKEVGADGVVRLRASRGYYGAGLYGVAIHQTNATYYAVRYLD